MHKGRCGSVAPIGDALERDRTPQVRRAVKRTGKSELHRPVADAGLRTVPEALPVEDTVIDTLSVPTFGSLKVALPLPNEFSLIVLTVIGISDGGPH